MPEVAEVAVQESPSANRTSTDSPRDRIWSALEQAISEIESAQNQLDDVTIDDEDPDGTALEDAQEQVAELERLIERAIEFGRRHYPMPPDWELLLSDMREAMGEAIGART